MQLESTVAHAAIRPMRMVAETRIQHPLKHTHGKNAVGNLDSSYAFQ
jgi:hypothetical protein